MSRIASVSAGEGVKQMSVQDRTWWLVVAAYGAAMGVALIIGPIARSNTDDVALSLIMVVAAAIGMVCGDEKGFSVVPKPSWICLFGWLIGGVQKVHRAVSLHGWGYWSWKESALVRFGIANDRAGNELEGRGCRRGSVRHRLAKGVPLRRTKRRGTERDGKEVEMERSQRPLRLVWQEAWRCQVRRKENDGNWEEGRDCLIEPLESGRVARHVDRTGGVRGRWVRVHAWG